MVVRTLRPAFDCLFTAASDNLTGILLGISVNHSPNIVDEAIMVLVTVWCGS